MGLQFTTLNERLAQRVRGPGGLYNLGNALGLASGLALHVAVTLEVTTNAGLAHGASAVVDYLAGSAGAFSITIAMLIFFWSGERYHMAWANGAPPDACAEPSGRHFVWRRRACAWHRSVPAWPTASCRHRRSSARHRQIRQRPPGRNLASPAVRAGGLSQVGCGQPHSGDCVVLIQVEESLVGDPAPPLAASACLLLCYLLWLKADVALFRS
jgi:hypothetical protein